MQHTPWWQGAVIYQVYPRSFMDSNNDGIGDLQGIIDRFDHIESLGVDAVWVSPFFKSPMKDFGYDISDYRDVDPLFGELKDFDALIARANQSNIKIIIDQVLSHTSDQHPWFEESRQDKTNPKADWYVWADPKPDGTAPNNWMSIFGGTAWQWEPRRGQYYLHNFLSSQPDLNFHNPDVQKAVLDNVEFWLKRGVGGFRLDAINFCFHDKQLRDNPAKPKELRAGRGFSEDNPYAYQYHYYNNTQPENLEFMEQLRQLFDKYDEVVSLGEISSEDSLKDMALYTHNNQRLNMAYSFELLTDDFSAQHIKDTVSSLEEQMTGGWPCWAVSNHDADRVVTRWGKGKENTQLARMLAAMLGSLKGSICTYQGEELGLGQAELSFEELQDPFGITFWPQFKGRDGCRTPMPWQQDAVHGGFSQVKPWLPVSAAQLPLSVDAQEQDPRSPLNSYRTFMKWRKAHSALVTGDIEFISTDDNVLLFIRHCPQAEKQKILCGFNFNEQATEIKLTQNIVEFIDASPFVMDTSSLPLDTNSLHIDGFSGFYAHVE
ncbi:alpha-glucosidase family protein [Psychrobium sp. MM17-31]|uniref:alpha-glucosidase n=1 Tax=Psychrobium sp. MM17-31 TaxID=2917758 RepID=UPI001EF505AB|nr:alpha-glucosidase [Psychrobium sp. MM17-31]MCG7532410.1 alpha-glucosidase family protein [Psychrobium sp. MM17-31]